MGQSRSRLRLPITKIQKILETMSSGHFFNIYVFGFVAIIAEGFSWPGPDLLHEKK